MAGADEGSRIRDVVRDSKILRDDLKKLGCSVHCNERDFPRNLAGEQRCRTSSFDTIEATFTLTGSKACKPKVRLPTFDGSSLSVDFLDWIDAFEDYFEDMNPPDAVICKLAASKLIGEAGIWWKELQTHRFSEGKNSITSWPRMRKLLNKKFLHTSRLTYFYKQENDDNVQHLNCSKNCPLEVDISSKVVNSVNISEDQVQQIVEGKEGKEPVIDDTFVPIECLTEFPNQLNRQENEDAVMHVNCLIKCPVVVYSNKNEELLGNGSTDHVIEGRRKQAQGLKERVGFVEGCEKDVEKIIDEGSESEMVEGLGEVALSTQLLEIKVPPLNEVLLAGRGTYLLIDPNLNRGHIYTEGMKKQTKDLKKEASPQEFVGQLQSMTLIPIPVVGRICITTDKIPFKHGEQHKIPLTDNNGNLTYIILGKCMSSAYSITKLVTLLFDPGGIFYPLDHRESLVNRMERVTRLFPDCNKDLAYLIYGQCKSCTRFVGDVVPFLFDPGGVPNFWKYFSCNFGILLDCSLQQIDVAIEWLLTGSSKNVRRNGKWISHMVLNVKVANGNVLFLCLWLGNPFNLFDTGKGLHNIKFYNMTLIILDNCEGVILEYSGFGGMQLNITHGMVQQNKVTRVIKENLVKKCIEIFHEINENNEDHKKFFKGLDSSLIRGMDMYDAMELYKTDGSTTCVGFAALIGVFILAFGENGKRLCMLNTKVMMIHQPLEIDGGKATKKHAKEESIDTKAHTLAKLFIEAGALGDISDISRNCFFPGYDKVTSSIIHHRTENTQALQRDTELEIQHALGGHHLAFHVSVKAFFISTEHVICRDLGVLRKAAATFCQLESSSCKTSVVLSIIFVESELTPNLDRLHCVVKDDNYNDLILGNDKFLSFCGHWHYNFYITRGRVCYFGGGRDDTWASIQSDDDKERNEISPSGTKYWSSILTVEQEDSSNLLPLYVHPNEENLQCRIKIIGAEIGHQGITLTRGRVIPWEGWNDVNIADMTKKLIMVETIVVIIGSCMNTLWKNGLSRKSLRLFHKVVNGLDPPML